MAICAVGVTAPEWGLFLVRVFWLAALPPAGLLPHYFALQRF
jgi:hypothetical protein